jgi:hypothetical protein
MAQVINQKNADSTMNRRFVISGGVKETVGGTGLDRFELD